MKIQVKDKTRNGKVFVRNLTSQKKVERQLQQIVQEISNINNSLRKTIYE